MGLFSLFFGSKESDSTQPNAENKEGLSIRDAFDKMGQEAIEGIGQGLMGNNAPAETKTDESSVSIGLLARLNMCAQNITNLNFENDNIENTDNKESTIKMSNTELLAAASSRQGMSVLDAAQMVMAADSRTT